jgi:2'-5' RNA ligase
MRAFIAISLPVDIRRSLTALHQELAQANADVKWVETDNLHVTLKFLDEITEEQRRAIEGMLARVAATHPAFSLGLTQLGAFPSMGSPHVIWVGLGEGREDAARIALAVEREAEALSLRKEERPFAAHVTLGRVRSPRGRQALARQLQAAVWQPPASWRVESITLYESKISSAGPCYTTLAEIPLIGPAGNAEASPAPSGRPGP